MANADGFKRMMMSLQRPISDECSLEDRVDILKVLSRREITQFARQQADGVNLKLDDMPIDVLYRLLQRVGEAVGLPPEAVELTPEEKSSLGI